MDTDTSTAPAGPLRIARSGPLFHIELNRPEARNPLGADTVAALGAALDESEANSSVRVLLITATGSAFSAGGNLGNIHERLSAPAGPDGRDPIALGNRQFGRFLMRLTSSRKIVVVAVQGAAMGGGAGLACAADVNIGVADARFGFPEAKIGLVPGQILPFVAARIGAQAARRLMLTGERIDGTEAHRIGLLDYVVRDAAALDQRLGELLTSLLACGPGASAGTKHLLRRAQASRDQDALTAYLDEASEMFASQMRGEGVEGVEASRAKRSPHWAVTACLKWQAEE